jgi:flagellar motility protein MotE (MotC chaperone)
MIRLARDFRLIPVVLLATICLFALKVSGLVFDGGYTLAERLQRVNQNGIQVTTRESVPDYPKIVFTDKEAPVPAFAAPVSKRPWAQEMLNYGGDKRDITGSVEGGEKPNGPPLKTSTKPPEPPKVKVGDVTVPIESGKIASASERAILGRLQDRRKELDARSRELEMRESLLKATEMRLDAKLAELKDMEARIKAAMGARDKAEADRFKGIVTMYQNMKPKDAARILERIDMKVLVEVVSAIKPDNMSQILAQMTPEAAERLTIELARRADGKLQNADQLPKIEGKSSGG